MDEFTGVILIVLYTIGVMSTGVYLGDKRVMKEAFERGYAVECLGETGYHWECDDE